MFLFWISAWRFLERNSLLHIAHVVICLKFRQHALHNKIVLATDCSKMNHTLTQNLAGVGYFFPRVGVVLGRWDRLTGWIINCHRLCASFMGVAMRDTGEESIFIKVRVEVKDRSGDKWYLCRGGGEGEDTVGGKGRTGLTKGIRAMWELAMWTVCLCVEWVICIVRWDSEVMVCRVWGGIRPLWE